MRDGEPVARRVTFGPACFSASKEGDKPTQKIRLVYAGKTVNFRIDEDDNIDQDYGVKPRPDEMRRLRNAMKGPVALFADKPVAIGERWRADEGLRALANLAPTDTISAIFTLKKVRSVEDGGQVADIALTAGVITSQHGAHAEISFEGTLTVDVKTGQTLAADLNGGLTIAAGAGRMANANAAALSLTGDGKLEIHTRGHMLGRESTTKPSTAGDLAGAGSN
jgi:hypothetical protein